MGDNHSHFTLYGKSPYSQFFVSLMIILIVGMFLFNGLILAGTLIYDRDFGNLFGTISTGTDEKDIKFLRYLLISQGISLFIIPSIIILTLMKPVHHNKLMDFKIPRINEVAIVIILAFCIIPITSFTGQLNSGMHLPDWLSGAEQWMKEKENNATRLIDLVISSDTFWAMMFNVLMIAVIPAIGEEFIFRGVFQKIFYNLFKSGHLAIWITAFAFSAIHFQFFGFVPRFILGLVFGYLFYWSGTLWLPVISHFINNVVPVIGAYILGWEKFNAPLDIPLWKQIIGLPLPIIISIIILLYFRKRSKQNANLSMDQFQFTNSRL